MPPPYTHMPTEGRYPSLTLRPAPPNPTDTQPPPTSTHPTPSSLPKGSVHWRSLRPRVLTYQPHTHWLPHHPLGVTLEGFVR